ncbi:hypothetical protein CsatB_026478 [Cannabis sativa]
MDEIRDKGYQGPVWLSGKKKQLEDEDGDGEDEKEDEEGYVFAPRKRASSELGGDSKRSKDEAKDKL